MATVLARLDLAVEHAAFKSGRQDVAQHHQRLFVGARREWVEAGIGMGYADEFGLCAVDLVAENPAACGAMGIHRPAAVDALAASADAGNQNRIARLETGDGGPTWSTRRRLRDRESGPARRSAHRPLRICRSVPQIVVLVILTMASVGAAMAGFGPSCRALLFCPR